MSYLGSIEITDIQCLKLIMKIIHEKKPPIFAIGEKGKHIKTSSLPHTFFWSPYEQNMKGPFVLTLYRKPILISFYHGEANIMKLFTKFKIHFIRK